MDAGFYYKSDQYISHTDSRKGLFNYLYHFVRSIMLGRKRRLLERWTKGRKALDIGSGTGYFMNELLQNNWEVSGIEISDQARAYCKEKFGLEVQSPEYLDNFPSAEKFNAITMWHVLEHVYDLPIILDKIGNLLFDDGILVVAVPNSQSYDAKHYQRFWAGWDVPRHLWHFNIGSLERLLLTHNLKIIQIKSMPMDGYYVSMLSEKNLKSGFYFIKGIIVGFIGQVLSLFDNRKSSSLIYVISKV
ncbi:MAG: class I SAM-dependent methyltransferase [Saprospiraceae bacterium]|nr:class I SAM-dependent methyltransferase [Saprospiraceae bacterium]